MTILNTYLETADNTKSNRSFAKNAMIGDKMTDEKALSFKEGVCLLDDGVHLLKEDGKIYIFRYK